MPPLFVTRKVILQPAVASDEGNGKAWRHAGSIFAVAKGEASTVNSDSDRPAPKAKVGER